MLKLVEVEEKVVLPTMKQSSYGRPRHYKSVHEVMSHIKGMFVNIKEYQNYVISNNLDKSGFPVNPYIYGSKYPGVDAFLGNPEGFYNEIRIQSMRNNRRNRVASKPVVVKQNQETYNLASILKILNSSYDVPSEVIYEVYKSATMKDLTEAKKTADIVIDLIVKKTKV
jgi:hypothetical protein